jgi:hypothetical protein
MSESALQLLTAWIDELTKTAEGQTGMRNTLLTGNANHVSEYLNGGATVLREAKEAVLTKKPTGSFATDCEQLREWVAKIST